MRYTPALMCLLFVTASPALWAGSGSHLKSSSGAVNLVAVLNEKLSIVPASTAVNAFMQPQVNGQTDRPLTTVTTSWNLSADGTGFAVRAFFSADGCVLENGEACGREVSAADVIGAATDGTLHPFPEAGNLAAGQNGGASYLLFRRQRTPGQSDFSSRTDPVELPTGSACPSQSSGGLCSGVLTLVAVVY